MHSVSGRFFGREFSALGLFWILLFGFAFACSGALVAQGEMEEDDDAAEDPRFRRAQRYHLTGELDEAFNIYDQILKDRGEDAPTLITYAHMKWKRGDYLEAEKRFKRAIELNPKHIKAKQFLGQMYLHQGRRKAARETFNALVALKWVREDVRHSGYLNLGKLELLDEQWIKARKHFRLLKKEGGKADRKSGKRGIKRMAEMRKFNVWPRIVGPSLFVHFNPVLTKTVYKDEAAREQLTASLCDCVVSICAKLKIVVPEPWHLYLFESDDQARQLTGRMEAHGWDYSWWINYNARGSGLDPRHTIACQLVARWCSGRPLSRMLVEGLAANLAGVDTDFHSDARKMLRDNRLRSMVECQKLLRSLDEHETRLQYKEGKSFVRFLIDTYGWESFEKLWKNFIVTVNAPRFKLGTTKGIDWQEAFDAIFEKGLGVKQSVAEARWREFLRSEG
ncbi:MAG: tetratricopeptide repeat protein [Planctomycetota bacterium]